jgi:putative tryptophan/tyrosine transport system substrate-binding protein
MSPFRGIGVPKASDVKRIFLLVVIITLLALSEGLAGAQQTTKVPRIGYLGLNDPSSPVFESFRQGLREVGYIEGQNVIIEPRFAFGNARGFTGLADELVRLQVDVIVAQSLQALNAARNATKTIPIVMAFADPAAAAGFVASRDGLGVNVTGISGMAVELGGKWLELLKQTAPEVSRVGVVYSRTSERVSPMMKELEVAARSLRVELQPAEVGLAIPASGIFYSNPAREVGAALTWATRGQAEALIVLPGFVFAENLGYIADLAVKKRLPSIFWRADFAEAGGLMAYGANPAEQFRRAAYVVDKILRGAKPTELPIELPKKFELVINLKTAKEIGVKIPDKMLTWADRIIK